MKIIDLHQDILIHQADQSKYKYKNQTSLDMIMKSDIRVVFGTGFVFGQRQVEGGGSEAGGLAVKPAETVDDFFASDCLDLIERDIDSYLAYAKGNPDFIVIKDAEDLASVCDDAEGQAAAEKTPVENRSNKKGVVIHVEGLNTFEDTQTCWNAIERFYEKGLRSIGITWTLENSFGGGNEAGVDRGLTPLGEKLIRWAFEKGVLVDYAHMNEKTFYDVARVAASMRAEVSSGGEGSKLLEGPKFPIFISHGNARALCGNSRNYSDDQLKMVKESGGLIGVFFANNCLVSEGLATVSDVVRHIRYISELVGIDHVAIGSDLGGLSLNIPEGLRDVFGFDNLAAALLMAGFTDEDVNKILFQNARRFLGAYLGKTLKVSQSLQN